MRKLISIVCVIGCSLSAVLAQGTGGWLIEKDVDPLDDSERVFAILTATEGGSQAPNLVVRCLSKSNTIEVWVNWRDYLNSDAGLGRQRVTYRFPPADAVADEWGVSNDNTSTFVWEDDDQGTPRQFNPSFFLSKLRESERLVVQTTPYNESAVTTIFDLTGTSEALASASEACGGI